MSIIWNLNSTPNHMTFFYIYMIYSCYIIAHHATNDYSKLNTLKFKIHMVDRVNK